MYTYIKSNTYIHKTHSEHNYIHTHILTVTQVSSRNKILHFSTDQHTYIHTYIHHIQDKITYIHTYLQSLKSPAGTKFSTWVLINIPTHIHTYIHTQILHIQNKITYIYTYLQSLKSPAGTKFSTWVLIHLRSSCESFSSKGDHATQKTSYLDLYACVHVYIYIYIYAYIRTYIFHLSIDALALIFRVFLLKGRPRDAENFILGSICVRLCVYMYMYIYVHTYAHTQLIHLCSSLESFSSKGDHTTQKTSYLDL
jgi:hypothetical protein